MSYTPAQGLVPFSRLGGRSMAETICCHLISIKSSKVEASRWDITFAQQRKGQNEKAIYGIGENICKPYIWQGANNLK